MGQYKVTRTRLFEGLDLGSSEVLRVDGVSTCCYTPKPCSRLQGTLYCLKELGTQ